MTWGRPFLWDTCSRPSSERGMVTHLPERRRREQSESSHPQRGVVVYFELVRCIMNTGAPANHHLRSTFQNCSHSFSSGFLDFPSNIHQLCYEHFSLTEKYHLPKKCICMQRVTILLQSSNFSESYTLIEKEKPSELFHKNTPKRLNIERSRGANQVQVSDTHWAARGS